MYWDSVSSMEERDPVEERPMGRIKMFGESEGKSELVKGTFGQLIMFGENLSSGQDGLNL